MWQKIQLMAWHILCFCAAARRCVSGGSETYFFRISGEMKNDLC
nr:hypothetical protein [Raoultella ornithinolytica]UUW42556.1 hypothetical protein [Citrobacter portucalensis]